MTTTTIDADAFPTDEEAIRRIEDASGASSGEATGFEKLEVLATLQDAKISKASNGDNYDLRFEVDLEGFVRLAVEQERSKGSFSLVWNQIHVGDGATLKGGSMTRNADGEMQYRINVHLPQSEIARSLGRIGGKLGKQAKMVLEPEQGSLNLAGGEKVDLTARAED